MTDSFPVLQIHSTTSNGSQAVGTGFVVGPRHIITCRHVIDPEWGPGKEASGAASAASIPRLKATPTSIVYPDDPDLDIVLLLVDEPIPGGSFLTAGRVRTEELQGHESWDTVGYPLIASGERLQLRGTTLPGRDDVPFMELDGAVGVSKEIDPSGRAWKGLSGSPVLIGGKLGGIIVQQDVSLDPPRVLAISMRRILDDPALARALRAETPSPDAYRAWSSDLLAEALRQAEFSKQDREQLGRLFELDASAAWENVAAAMLSGRLNALEVLTRLRSVAESPGCAGQWEAVLNVLLPAFTDWDRLVPQILNESEPMTLSISDAIVADMILARMYGDRSSVRRDGSWICGSREIKIGLNRPWDPKFTDLRADIRQAIDGGRGRDLAEAITGKTRGDLGGMPDNEYAAAEMASQRDLWRLEASVDGVQSLSGDVPPHYIILATSGPRYQELFDEAAKVVKESFGEHLAVIRADYTADTNTDHKNVAVRVRAILNPPSA